MRQAQCRGKHVLLGAHVLCGEHVVEHRHALPKPNVLEGACNAELGHLIRRRIDGVNRNVFIRVFACIELLHLAARVVCHDGLVVELNQPVGGVVDTGNAVKRGRLTRAVRADERDDLALIYLKGQVVDGDDAAELHGYMLHAQNVFRHRYRLPSPLWRVLTC